VTKRKVKLIVSLPDRIATLRLKFEIEISLILKAAVAIVLTGQVQMNPFVLSVAVLLGVMIPDRSVTVL
jgi:hypothetical protein